MKTMTAALGAALLAGCSTMSPQMQVAEAVSSQVNRQIEYTPDAQQYGQSDRWVVEPTSGRGDCEDYALTKAERLNAGGITTSVDICLRGDGYVAHAVAIVHDGDEEWVLDNIYPRAIRRQDYTCQRWLSAATLGKEVHHGR